MSRMRKAIYMLVKKLMPDMWFELLWYFYVTYHPKFKQDRWRRAYFRKGIRIKGRYCILRYATPGLGIGAVARLCLFACEWAEQQGMIPIVDLEYEYFSKHGMVGKDNIWEYVFEQEDSAWKIYQQKPVFVGEMNGYYRLPSMSKKLLGSNKEHLVKFKTEGWREYYRQLNKYSNKWWVLRPEIKERFEATYTKLFKPGMRILGVALREEFSKNKEDIEGSCLIRHPHEPNVIDMIKIIKEYKEKWNCTHIFVTTMYQDSIEVLEREFGDSLIYTGRKRIDYNTNSQWTKRWEKYIKKPDELYSWVNEERNKQFADFLREEFVVDYMEEVYGLSKCNCFLTGKNGGSLVACIWNGGKYEELRILEDDNKSILY